MKLRSVALVGVSSLAALGLIGVGVHAVFTTSTTSGQTITAGTGWTTPPPTTPTVTISYPVDGTTYGADWGGAITGTVSDALGSVTGVGVSLQQGSGSTSCWTGSGNTYTASCPNYLPVTTGTTTWSLTLPTTVLTSGDSYNVTAQATDSLANVFTSSTVGFTYNIAAPALPTVAITYPVDGTIYGTDWGGAITGTSSANAKGASLGRGGLHPTRRRIVLDRHSQHLHGELPELRGRHLRHRELVAQPAEIRSHIGRHLHGHGPGHRLCWQPRHELDGHLLLRHHRPDC